MTNNTASNVFCAMAALLVTTLTFAEVTSVQSVDFEYEEQASNVLQA